MLAIGRALKAAGYAFVAPTPLTCGRYLARPRRADAAPLVEAFGWNRPFQEDQLDESWRELLDEAGVLERLSGGFMRSRIRFSSLGGMLFVHSGFPTLEADAIFFGPDTYRFAGAMDWLRDCEPDFAPERIVDIGTGSGAGGLYAGSLFGESSIVLADINPRALEFAEVNAELNGIAAQTSQSDVFQNVSGMADLVISNPPYLIDAARRAYRHGGGDWGCALPARIFKEALEHLSERGHLLLYTGTPIVAGTDKFLEMIQPLLKRRVKQVRYREIDPDVFGEELENPPYDQADRIATIVLHVKAADIIR